MDHAAARSIDRSAPVRVFISSTFRDMGAERDHLVKVVFPELRERLLPHRIRLVDVDLRWGVTREQAENDRVLDVCLGEVDACRPFFIGLLGERYGWVPGPRPRDEPFHGWVQAETGKSLTELEIRYGALAGPAGRAARSFFFFRDPDALRGVPDEVLRRDYVEADPAAVARLGALKQAIRDSGLPLVDGYPCRWDAGRGRLAGLEAFGEAALAWLWQAIVAERRLDREPAAGGAGAEPDEDDGHLWFAQDRLVGYGGRDAVHGRLLTYLDGADGRPLLLVGPSGSGKSSILSRLAQTLRGRPGGACLAHFVGATPASSDPRAVLRRVCRFLQDVAGVSDPLPDELPALTQAATALAERVPADRPAAVLIDAVDTLEGPATGDASTWLPSRPTPHVRWIVSCRAPGDGEPAAALDRLRRRGLIELPVEPLTDGERLEITCAVPSLSAKALDPQQVGLLLRNPETANPLYLRVALEELRGFGSFERLDDRIRAFPHGGVADGALAAAGFSPHAMRGAGDPLTALFVQVFERLEEEFPRDVVRAVLTLLAAARRGLAERELRALVDGTPGSEMLFPVLRQLRPYLQYRGELLGFFHLNVQQAAERHFFAEPDARTAAHARLAALFGAEPPHPAVVGRRRAEELPWQLQRAGGGARLARLLVRPEFLEEKVALGLTFDLAEDLRCAAGTLTADGPLTAAVRRFAAAIGRDVVSIARESAQGHDEALFQSLWNTCWWHDHPEASRHYEAFPDATLPWGASPDAGGPRLHELMEAWRAWRRGARPGFSWLRACRPPRLPLASGLRVTLLGHRREVTALAVDPAGARVASGDKEGGVRVWDAQTGENVRQGETSDGEVLALRFSPDGHRLAALSTKRCTIWSVDRWDSEWTTGSGGHAGTIAPDLQTVAFGYQLSLNERIWELRLWDLPARRVKRVAVPVPAGETFEQIRCVAFSPDGSRLLCSCVNQLGVYSLAEDRWIWNEPLEPGESANGGWQAAFSPDGARIAVAMQAGAADSLRIHDAATGALSISRPLADAAYAVAWASDGARLALGLADGSVDVVSRDGAARGHKLVGHASTISVAAFAGDGLITGSEDGTVRIWALDDDPPGYQLPSPITGSVLGSGADPKPSDRLWTATRAPGPAEFDVEVWDVGAVRRCCVVTMRGPSSFGPEFHILPTGRVGVSTYPGIQAWRLADAQPIAGHGLPWREGTSFAGSLAARTVAMGGSDGTVRAYGEDLDRLLWEDRASHEGEVWPLALSADGRLLASTDGGRVCVFELATGRPVRSWRFPRGKSAPSSFARGIAFVGRDASRLAVETEAGLRVIDLATGAAVRFPSIGAHAVFHFSASGRLLAHRRGRLDAVDVYDAEGGGKLFELPCIPSSPAAMGITADDAFYVESSDHRTRVWDLRSRACVRDVHGEVVDLAEVAARGPGVYPYWGLRRGDGFDVMTPLLTRRVASLGDSCEAASVTADGRGWVLRSRQHLGIFRLEQG